MLPRKLVASLAVVALGVSASTAPRAQSSQSQLSAQITGSYSLSSVYDELSNGQKRNPWGDGVKGVLYLDPVGHFSYQIVAAGRDKNASKSPRTPVPAYVGAFGTYTVDEAGKTLTYHVIGSSFPAWEGMDRHIQIDSVTDSELSLVSAVNGDSELGNFHSHQEWRRNVSR